ncbi:ABC transporter permease subunit [Paenalcaligenes niemegkensis]|uniref:ABC transporter permease n=1 Tax=Paenalcaligenes niemegkensis TaxID=2895469 RepID=UPI001EE87866|nr:ABC transporter permease subunit [Paenalcaligenes niemegkensis]MCQ9618295.1 ABC transporter permease subunit [Paenalcaligenes niemegkensis]
MLHGYLPLILKGVSITAALALCAILLSTFVGIVGALLKGSHLRLVRAAADLYTTLNRGVPDLVIMLLVFYNLQMLVNYLCSLLNIQRVEIDAFTAGVITLAFIHGAYMTETFRGALGAIPSGQAEAGLSTGMSPWSVFWRITFPQMLRYAIPGYSNNIQVVIKSTALVSIIGLVDIISITQQAGRSTQQLFFFNLVAAGVYLAFTCVALAALSMINKRVNRGTKGVRL